MMLRDLAVLHNRITSDDLRILFVIPKKNPRFLGRQEKHVGKPIYIGRFTR